MVINNKTPLRTLLTTGTLDRLLHSVAQHITTFAVQLNSAYLQHHSDPQLMLEAYGKALSKR